MRLSQHERRMLAELEQALTREDPRFVQQFAVPPTATAPGPARAGPQGCLSSDRDRDTSAVDELDRVHVLRSAARRPSCRRRRRPPPGGCGDLAPAAMLVFGGGCGVPARRTPFTRS